MAVGTNLLTINGVIDTDKTIAQNIDELSIAAGVWTTFDVNTGKWSVIIQKPAVSVSSFNDSNIIGAITISGSGTTNVYNTATVTFPNKDVLNHRDTSLYQLPQNEWLAGEVRNSTSLSINLVNDPIQVGMITMRELRQSRLDKIIQFQSDFSKIGVKAGEVIDVTSSMHGFNQKLFRVISIEERDDDTGGIGLSFTALEYDDLIYNYTDLERVRKYTNTGIPAKANNLELIAIDQKAYTENLSKAIATDPKVSNPTTGLSTALGIFSLLNAVDGLFRDDKGAGGLFKAIMDLFKDDTGIDLQETAKNGGLGNGGSPITPEQAAILKEQEEAKAKENAKTGPCTGNLAVGSKSTYKPVPDSAPACFKVIHYTVVPPTAAASKNTPFSNGRVVSSQPGGPHKIALDLAKPDAQVGDLMATSPTQVMKCVGVNGNTAIFEVPDLNIPQSGELTSMQKPVDLVNVDGSVQIPFGDGQPLYIFDNNSPEYELRVSASSGTVTYWPPSASNYAPNVVQGYPTSLEDTNYKTNNSNYPIIVKGNYDEVNNALRDFRWEYGGNVNNPDETKPLREPAVRSATLTYQLIPSNGSPSTTYNERYEYMPYDQYKTQYPYG